ncbi:hypothetical protein Tco_0273428, partial [Tanacetum coccineum]
FPGRAGESQIPDSSHGLFYQVDRSKGRGKTYQRLVDKAFDKQVGRNLEVYVDDLVIKSHTKEELFRAVFITISQYRYAATSTCAGTSDREPPFTKAPVAIPATKLSSYPDSVKSPFSHISFFQASVNVIYPASVVHKASMCCKLAFKLHAHPSIINQYPVIDLPMTVIDLPTA